MFVASLEKILISNYPGADLQPYGGFFYLEIPREKELQIKKW